MAIPAKQKHIFITGASGYIGSRVTEFAIAEGYTVTGLSRTPSSDTKIIALGATPVRGDLSTHDILTRESAKADIVFHLADAMTSDWSMEYAEVVRIDNAAVDAIAEGLEGSGKPLIVSSGSGVVASAPDGGETNETSPLWEKPLNDRIKWEVHALAQAKYGIRVSALRLAPYVYGRGASGVRVRMMMAATSGAAMYIGDGEQRISAAHVDDTARLYLLAAKNARTGEAYNATVETSVTNRQLAEAIGEILDVPTQSMPYEEVQAKYPKPGFLAGFLSLENRASNAKAIGELAWKPKERGILEEIRLGSYAELAKTMRRSANEVLKKPLAQPSGLQDFI